MHQLSQPGDTLPGHGGIVSEQNIVSFNQDKRHGITTTPFASAAGDVLPVQVIAKGAHAVVSTTATCRLTWPATSASGWQTEDTFVLYIGQHLHSYLGPEGGVLVIDEYMYSAHTTDKVTACLNDHYIVLIVVPAGMTHIAAAGCWMNAHPRRSAVKPYTVEQYTDKENSDPNAAAAMRINNALHETNLKAHSPCIQECYSVCAKRLSFILYHRKHLIGTSY